VEFEVGSVGRTRWATNGGGGRVPVTIEDGNVCRVLEPDRTPRTLVFVIHEEVVNQFPGMAYFGGVFSGGGISMRAMNYVPEHPYPVRATLDVSGFWRLRGFSRFSVVHLIMSCFSQCYGY
jgi:hypothetical protein